MGSSPGERKIKESQMEANREAGSKCHFRSSLQLTQEPAPERSYPSHQGTYTEQSLRGGKMGFTENDQSPTSNVVSLPLPGFTTRENLTSLKLGGGVIKKLSFRHLPCTHLGRTVFPGRPGKGRLRGFQKLQRTVGFQSAPLLCRG